MIQTPRTHTSPRPLLRHVQPEGTAAGPIQSGDEADLAARWQELCRAENQVRALPPSPPAPPPMTADGLRVGSAQAKLLAALRDGPGTRRDLCARAGISLTMWSSALAQIRAAGIVVQVERARAAARTVYRLEDKT